MESNTEKYCANIISALSSEPMQERDVRMMNALVLAFIGDTICDLYIRTLLVLENDSNVNTLHNKASGFVRASAQSEASGGIMDILNEDEMAVYKRGRNTNARTVPKNADIGDYRRATGFEAVLGYLYLLGRDARLRHLLDLAFKFHDDTGEK